MNACTMTSATLTIDLNAITANWAALDGMTGCETAAVVKADAYGCGAGPVARALAAKGVARFFVALAEEGVALRAALGPGPMIAVLSGHMAGDADRIRDAGLTPCLNSLDQVLRHLEALPAHPFALQLDTGMNRLGLEPEDWAGLRQIVMPEPAFVMSHLACADEPGHPMNARQLKTFREMTDGIDAPRSLAATGGILLGPDYHFDFTRPGIGLHGADPFRQGRPSVRLDLPVIQTRDVVPGETVGYSNTWEAARPSRIATVAAGYADGLHRAMSGKVSHWAGDTPCPIVGRISMDLITVDVTGLPDVPPALSILNGHQRADDLAALAGTIGYEVLTSLGARLSRRYVGGV